MRQKGPYPFQVGSSADRSWAQEVCRSWLPPVEQCSPCVVVFKCCWHASPSPAKPDPTHPRRSDTGFGIDRAWELDGGHDRGMLHMVPSKSPVRREDSGLQVFFQSGCSDYAGRVGCLSSLAV